LFLPWEVDQNNIGILAQPIKDDVRATGCYVEGQHRRWIVIQPLNAPCAACQLKFVARPAHLVDMIPLPRHCRPHTECLILPTFWIVRQITRGPVRRLIAV